MATNYNVVINSTGSDCYVYDKNSNDITSLGYWNDDLKPLTFKTIAQSGYTFTTAPTVKWRDWMGQTRTTTLTLDSSTGYYSSSSISPDSREVTFNSVAEKSVKDYAVNIYASNTECLIYDKDENDITNLGSWNETLVPLTFKTKPNDGYYYETIPYVNWYDSMAQPRTTTLTLDESTGYYVTTITPALNAVNFFSDAVARTVIKNKYGLITVYDLQPDDMKEIAKSRFFYDTSTAFVFYEDLGEFISKLHVVYAKIETERTQRLYLGNYPIGSSTYPVIDDNVIMLDCGNITINEKYNNVVDYKANVKIMLPFIGFKTLETSDVMGQTLHLYYKLDVITGSAKAYICSVDGETETVIETFDCIMSYNIPFVSLTDIEKTYDLNSNFLWGFESYVIVSTPRLYGDYETFGNNVSQVDTIGNFYGYVSFEEIELETSATETERNEIIKLLQEGVIL